MGDFDKFKDFVDDNIIDKVKDVVKKEVDEFKDAAELTIKMVGDDLKVEAKANLEDIKDVIINEMTEAVIPFLIANTEGFLKKAGKAVVGFLGRNISRLKFW